MADAKSGEGIAAKHPELGAMRTLSRWMPAAPVRTNPPWAWPIVGLFALGLLYLIYSVPWLAVLLGGIALFTWVGSLIHARHFRRLAAARADESIGTFARSLDCRQTDTWILRAVYEELSRYVAVDGHPLPIRADDRWEEDLKIDPEDFGDLAVAIADRAGRSLDNMEANPYYAELKTVRDLVRFFENQPKLQKAEPLPGAAAG